MVSHDTRRGRLGVAWVWAWTGDWTRSWAWLLAAALAVQTESPRAAEPQESPVFVTGSSLEPDKCASIWLIRRFVSPSARILFFDPASPAPAGTPFDTPDAALRRYHNASTFETLARHFRIDDPKVAYLGRLMHDIEINTWARKALPQTRQVEWELAEALPRVGVGGAIDFCVAFFDGVRPGSGSR